MDLLEKAAQNSRDGWKLLEDIRIIPEWERIGATVHVVGSLKTGLMMKNRDIDLHIYTDRVDVRESFSVMRELAEQAPFKEVQYRNLIDTEEECIEWHAGYETGGGTRWKFDMIHIRRGSRYDGVVERVTEAVGAKMTPQIRQAILQIKYDMPEGMTVPGIEIYRAVFSGGVRNYAEFEQWREGGHASEINSLDWLP